jgi:hypothetical protein
MKTFKIYLKDMYKETKQPKKHQQKFKRWLLDQKEYIQHKKPQEGDTYNDIFRKETDQERRERVKKDNANIQRVDNQIKR